MGSKTVNNKSSYRMHKERKKYLKEHYNRIIDGLISNKFRIGLIKKENIISPIGQGEFVTGEDVFSMKDNYIFIERKLYKFSKVLNYNVVLTFDEDLFNDPELEEIKCKSLSNHILTKIIPRIIKELNEKIRKINVALRIEKPNREDLIERQLIKEEKEYEEFNRRCLLESLPDEIKNIKVQYAKEKSMSKLKVTKEQKHEKWIKLKDNNIKQFKEKIGKLNINIKFSGYDIKPKNLKRVSVDEGDSSDSEFSVFDKNTLESKSSNSDSLYDDSSTFESEDNYFSNYVTCKTVTY